MEQLIWVDRQGRQVSELGEPADYGGSRLSPSGDRLAVVVAEQIDSSELWIFDLARGVPTRFTFSGSGKRSPVWAGEEQLIFSSTVDRMPNLWSRRFGAAEEERLLPPTIFRIASDVSPDGRSLLFFSLGGTFLLDLGGQAEAEATPFFATELGGEREARFSPDGRWVAFTSDETGRPEVYLARQDQLAVRHRVSAAGGLGPRFRADGRELFYLSLDDNVMAVNIDLAKEPEIGTAAPLFALDGRRFNDVSPDGERFLLTRVDRDSRRMPLNVVVGWQALIPE